MNNESALARALKILDDLPDVELIEVASVIEEDAKMALDRRDRVRGALMRRMHEKGSKALADADGQVAVELKAKREYEWDSDALVEALGPRDREKYLKWVDPTPGRWVPKSPISINNLIEKLGNDQTAARLKAARRMSESEYVKFVQPS